METLARFYRQNKDIFDPKNKLEAMSSFQIEAIMKALITLSLDIQDLNTAFLDLVTTLKVRLEEDPTVTKIKMSDREMKETIVTTLNSFTNLINMKEETIGDIAAKSGESIERIDMTLWKITLQELCDFCYEEDGEQKTLIQKDMRDNQPPQWIKNNL